MPKIESSHINPLGFREYDARWLYPKDINNEGIKSVGQGFGSQIISKTNKFPRVLYGGSVNAKNIKLLSSINEIDGFLIGGSSQSSKKFIDIIKNYYK